jgi:ankyrin repeat protein
MYNTVRFSFGIGDPLDVMQAEWARVRVWLSEPHRERARSPELSSNPPERVCLVDLALHGGGGGPGPYSCRHLLAALEATGAGRDGSVGWSALHQAVQWAMREEAGRLVQNGFPVDTPDEQGKTPLHQAAMWGYEKMHETLLALGTAADARDLRGASPLHDASVEGHLEVMSRLVGAGVDPDVRDGRRRTPLHVASCIKSLPAIRSTEKLLSLGASIDATDEAGRTPLHLAVQNGCSALASVLARAGADLTVKDCDGLTPWAIARSMEAEEAFRFLGGSSARE